MAPSATVISSAPDQSNLTLSLVASLSGTRQIVSTTVTSARGRLIKNTHRQDACCTSHPPSTGPIAAVIAVKPDHVPIARPRCSGEKGNANQRETVRYKERRADALNAARNDELADVPGNPAPCRRRGEEHHASREHLSAAIQIAYRSANQKQRGEKQGIGLNHPFGLRGWWRVSRIAMRGALR